MYIYKGGEMDSGISFHKYDDYIFHSVPHVHRDFEFVYVTAGSVHALIDGIPAQADAGDCIMILPHQIHFYDAGKTSSSVVVNFSGEIVPAFLSDLGNSTVDRNAFRPDKIAEIMIRTFFLDDAAHTIYEQKCVLYSICNSFLKSVRLIPKEFPEHAPAYRVIHYIAEHYRQDISLQEIAKELGYEYHYLSRMFHKTTNVSFRDFLNYHRIEYARSVLKNSDLPIAQIALDAGFQNVRSFNRAFQKITGVAPNAFRTSEEGNPLPRVE